SGHGALIENLNEIKSDIVFIKNIDNVQHQSNSKISKDGIESSEQGARIDYLELLDADTLSPVENIATPCVLATAVFYGKVRLIDNIELG
ncbi:MAG: pantoate--beta-alanine ligase, partial [Akkermansiaceae bacterium]